MAQVTVYENLMGEFWQAAPSREVFQSFYFLSIERLPQYLDRLPALGDVLGQLLPRRQRRVVVDGRQARVAVLHRQHHLAGEVQLGDSFDPHDRVPQPGARHLTQG